VITSGGVCAPVLESFGDAALRARLPEGAPTRAVFESLRALAGVVDAVVTERHALVTFDPASPPAGVGEAIARALSAPLSTAEPRGHSIAVRYDGPDVDEVARVARMTRDEVIGRHVRAVYVVAAIGFMPGFAYLRGLDPRLVLPRKATPRPRVPAGSVAIAGPYTGVYPLPSPGGWHLLGTATGAPLFDARSGATLALGDRVTFVEAP
jgi:KipI family sensor histidine kinase inhibitor